MSVLAELERPNVRLVYKLEISGLKEVYYSGPTPPAVAGGRVAVPGIKSASSIRSQLDLLAATSNGGAVTVKILATRTNGVRNRLLRLGPRGARRYATLATSLDQSVAAGVVHVEEDISAWPLSGVVWVGREAIRYTSRTVVAPFELTVPAFPDGRGYYDSEVQAHVVDPARGLAPRVYSDPIRFRGRWARLSVCALRPGGSLAEQWVQELNGFVQADPELEGDGHTVTVRLIDPTSVLDRKIGGRAAQTTLQEGWHVLDGETGHKVSIVQSWPTGAAWSAKVTANTPGGFALGGVNYSAHQDAFDATVSGPRRGQIFDEQGQQIYNPDPAGAYAGPPENGTINIDPAGAVVAPPINQHQVLKNIEGGERYEVELTPTGTAAALRWPEEAVEIVNAAWSPGTNKGANGMIADVRLEPYNDRARGPALTCRVNSHEHRAGPRMKFNEPHVRDRDMHYFGIDMADPADETRTLPHLDGQGWSYSEQREVTLESNRFANDTRRDILPIRRIANGYWAHDRWLHVEHDVFSAVAPTRVVFVRVIWEEGDDEYRSLLRVQDKVTADSVFPGVPGWLLEVVPADRMTKPAFGNFPGGRPVKIQEVPRWEGVPPWRIVLELLLSGEGTGFNHADYDVLFGGLNLTTDLVDVDSFERFPSPGGLVSRTDHFEIFEERSIKDVISPLLRAMNAALVPKLNPQLGERKLALVPVGVAARVDAIATIVDVDWRGRGRPATKLDHGVKNAFVLKLNYDWRNDKHRLEIDADDYDAIQEGNPRTPSTEDLRGFEVHHDDIAAQRAAVEPLVAEWFALAAYPRKLFTGLLDWSGALRLDVGSVVLITAEHVVGYDGQVGITGVPMRVVRINRDAARQLVEIGCVYHDANPGGWAPALKVSSVIDATTVEVKPNAYTEAFHPITGEAQTDLDWFAVGDLARSVPTGNYAAGTGGMSVLSISGLQLQFSAPHGITAPHYGTIRLEAYGAVRPELQDFAFFADDAGTLGAAGDDAKDFA